MDRLTRDRMFIAVLDTGSFAAAAARLGTSGGQASKLVSALETELGVQLLHRTTRALAPTDAGQTYYLRIRDLLAEYDALDASLRDVTAEPSGRLRLSAPETFGLLQLTPVLTDFARAHPKVDLDVSFSDRMVSLIDEGFDMALRIGDTPDSSLITRRLCDARIVTIAAPAYLAQRGTPRTPPDLVDHDCIIDTNFRDDQTWVYPGAPPQLVKGRIRFSSAGASLAAAKAGLGITRCPSFVAGPAIAAGEVITILAPFEPPSRPIHAIYPPARHKAAKVRAMIDHLARAFKGQPQWDRGWPEPPPASPDGI